jgi:hypothetical protein
MTSAVTVGYNNKDFFYRNAKTAGDMPTQERCTDILNYSKDKKYIIDVEASESNVKIIKLDYSKMIVPPVPVNKLPPNMNYTFELTVNGHELTIKRTDSEEGWTQPLQFEATRYLLTDDDCQGEEFNINRQDCLDTQLCKNKDYSVKILDMQKSHTASEQKYDDSQSVFNRELFKTANLSIGVIGLVVLIYRFKTP